MHAIAERHQRLTTSGPWADARPVPPGRWRKGRDVARHGARATGVPWALIATNLLGFHLADVAEREGIALLPVALLLAFDGLWALCHARRIERIRAWALVVWGLVCAWGGEGLLAVRGGGRGPIALTATFAILVFSVGLVLDGRTRWFR